MYDLASEFNISTNYSLSPKFNAMMGFTEEEVRKMLTYYSTNSPFRHTVDELIGMMKPWYNNYCFAKESDNFVSLLYYFGMLTISGMHEGKTKLTIPQHGGAGTTLHLPAEHLQRMPSTKTLKLT